MIKRRGFTKALAAGWAIGSIHAAKPETLGWKAVGSGIWKATVGVPEAYTPVKARLVAEKHSAGLLPEVGRVPLADIAGTTTGRGCLLRLPLEPGEQVYGFGLQLLSFAQRAKKKTIRVNADPKLDTGDSHAPVPFYVTTRGYGVLVDTARQADFYCGNARFKPERAQPRKQAAVNTPDAGSEAALQAAAEVTVEIPRAHGVDVYLFAGPSMVQAVQRYNLFAGGGVVPPGWGLGFWYRAEGQGDQQSIARLAKEFRDRKIPCDVMGLEPGWQSHAYSCSFAWDAGRFPDPKSLLDDLGKQDFHVNLWEHAFTHPTSPLFKTLLPHAGDYAVWGGLVPDFASDATRKEFGNYHGRALIDLGVAGFKLDECDGSDYTGGWSFPDFSRFPSGVDGEQMHAVFGLRYQDAIWQQFRERRQATYGLVRSSGALAAPYPFVLYSDLYGHREFVRALVNSGFSGLLWCPEVRDAESEEDLIRRLQTVVFSPLAMVNAWYIKHPPWQQIERTKNNADEFSSNWEKLEARCREIIGWRMQMVPYLLSAFERYAADGTPPFRALILDDADDPQLAMVDDEYMVGDRMLVAPLFAGEAERKIVLPKGAWHDFWTGNAVDGGRSFTVPATTEKIPVFVKAGSVLPLATVGASTAAADSKTLQVLVYGDGSLPWRSGGPGNGLLLRWDDSAKKGRVEGSSVYRVTSWEGRG